MPKGIAVDRNSRVLSHRSGFDDVAYDEFLDRFVLRGAPSAVRASHSLRVTTALFRSTIVTSLLRHFGVLVSFLK